MWENLDVALEKVAKEKTEEVKPDQDKLGFGLHFTDHMLLMKWDQVNGWHDAKISPYQDFRISTRRLDGLPLWPGDF
jgi:branched-chain amino acid aminotransferase